jgi:hypothetical protein
MNERGISVARTFCPRAAHNRRLLMERLESRDLLAAFDVLVFSKTAGFRHSSIDEGVAAIFKLVIKERRGETTRRVTCSELCCPTVVVAVQ